MGNKEQINLGFRVKIISNSCYYLVGKTFNVVEELPSYYGIQLAGGCYYISKNACEVVKENDFLSVKLGGMNITMIYPDANKSLVSYTSKDEATETNEFKWHELELAKPLEADDLPLMIQMVRTEGTFEYDVTSRVGGKFLQCDKYLFNGLHFTPINTVLKESSADKSEKEIPKTGCIMYPMHQTDYMQKRYNVFFMNGVTYKKVGDDFIAIRKYEDILIEELGEKIKFMQNPLTPDDCY